MEITRGTTIGWLTVLRFHSKDEYSRKFWECECKCGNKTCVRESDLKRGHTRSCGCMRGWNNAKKY